MPFACAEDDDVWYRWLLKATEQQPGQAGVIKYFEDRFVPPIEDGRPWVLELSGRLYSMGPDFRADAEVAAAALNARRGTPVFAYRGRWLANVRLLRANEFDVMHEPTILPHDDAHANAVVIAGDMVDSTGKIKPFAAQRFHAALSFDYP